MVGRKKKNVYRKKRSGKPFTGVQKQSKKATKRLDIEDPVPSATSSESQPISASRKKMRLETSDGDSSSGNNDEEQIFRGQGYRLIDLNKFSSSLSEAHVCEEGEKYFRLMSMKQIDINRFEHLLNFCGSNCFCVSDYIVVTA